MSYKSPDRENSYKDDAFGLVFLTGRFFSQDLDFVGSFFILSSIAAVATTNGFVDKDDRAPAAVALITLLKAPAVSSMRQTGNLDNILLPLLIEIGVCTIQVSSIWLFVNWSQNGGRSEDVERK